MKQQLMIFAYDFPNFKTQEVLLRLLIEEYPVAYVIGAPRKKLNRPVTTLRDAPSFVGLIETRAICKRFNIPYLVFDHNSNESEKFIAEHPVDIGIIAGAQILKPNIVRLFQNGGIVNTHEAMLPWIRGLDTLKWSIYKGLPMVNSIHFIEKTIDEGRLIYQEKLELKLDDTLIDISLRFIQMKPEVLVKALKILETADIPVLPELGKYKGEYLGIMPPELARTIPNLLPKWLLKYQGPAEPLDPFSEPYISIAGKTRP